MKLDFIHVGMHKTASTLLQKKIFPSIENLKVLNNLSPNIDEWFMKEFVNKSANEFSSKNFLYDLNLKVDSFPKEHKGNILAISEENLSGDIYSGANSSILRERLYDVFGNVKILIVIRNQLDFILSAYSNYIYHGGRLRFTKWFQGKNASNLLAKLHYSDFISGYSEIYGKKNVTVLLYEEIFEKQSLHNFLKQFQLDFVLKNNKRINVGASILGNNFFAFLNHFGMHKLKGRQQIRSIFPKLRNEREFLKDLIGNEYNSLVNDNKKISIEKDLNLTKEYYI